MNFIIKVWDKIKKPKPLWLILFYILSVALIAGTITLVVIESNQSILHYVLYAFSAISLTYLVYTIVIYAPKIKQSIINQLKKYKFTNEILENYGYRTIMFSVFSFILNLAYVGFMGVLAFRTLSAWYISITAYYLILALMKGSVFYSKRKHNTIIKQATTYRFCGILFIMLMIAFSGVILLIYTSNMAFEYAGLMIYAVAAFTFYKLGLAIYNIFKARKQDDLYIQSIRNINLSNALISIIVLQVALFQAFSPQSNTSIANALTGAGVSFVIIGLGIYMIIKANQKIKQEKTNEEQK